MPASRKITWQRVLEDPFLIPQEGTAAPDAVTTPDVLLRADRIEVYTGAVAAGSERIIRFPLPDRILEEPVAAPVPLSACLAVEPGPGSFDSTHVFDPASVRWKGRTYLYYSAIGQAEDSIGLAVLEDGESFKKHPEPVLPGRSPEIVASENRLHLFYVLRQPGQGYRIFTAISTDGLHFIPQGETPVVGAGLSEAWDGVEVTTPRIFERNGKYYLLYAASQHPDRYDMPDGFGLARSEDLIRWEKYPHNPVFRLGEPGQWDDGAIWFGTVFPYRDELYLIYEGGRLENILAKVPALTQVGLAKISGNDFDLAVLDW
jgi:hypothetical protein